MLHEGETVPCQTNISSVDSEIRNVLYQLSDIEAQFDYILSNIQESDAEQGMKDGVLSKLRMAHIEKRQPYLEKLNRLVNEQITLLRAA